MIIKAWVRRHCSRNMNKERRWNSGYMREDDSVSEGTVISRALGDSKKARLIGTEWVKWRKR